MQDYDFMQALEMIENEIVKLAGFEIIGQALTQFIYALHPNGDFTRKGDQWVYDPNFVTISIHYKKSRNIVLCLRGNPQEFDEDKRDFLSLEPAMAGYSRCKITSDCYPPDRYLAVASYYIERAYELWQRGRTRSQKTPKTIES